MGRCAVSGGGSRLYAPMGDRPRPLRPMRAEQGRADILSLRRLGGAGRGVVWRANQGPRASPAQRNGGPSGRRNAFRWESRSSGADEACRLRQDEGCAACDGDGRGRARERSEFSPLGGNRVKRTLRGRSDSEESVFSDLLRNRNAQGRGMRILRPSASE